MNTAAIYQMNKQQILNRMLKVVTKHTGIKQIDLLDPLLVLITQSMAEEIYKVLNEIDNIENRIIESVSSMLCPDALLWAHPAHCILHANPCESSLLLTHSTSFQLKDKQFIPAGNSELKFNPVCNTFIHKGSVRYIIHGGLCYAIETDQTKTLLFRSRNPKFTPSTSYWIALDLDDVIKKIEKLSFYFDLQGVSSKNEYLDQFQFTTWKLNGKKMSLSKGLNWVDTSTANEEVVLFDRFKATQIIDESILKTYHKHYLTIEDDILPCIEKKKFPQELNNCFDDDLMQEFDTPLLWFEIELPPIFSAAITESLTVSINTFPVANKYLVHKTINLDEVTKIIPLETDYSQSLLAVESVTDSTKNSYYELPFNNTSTEQHKTYSLRRGGYERYSKRDAREYLSNFTGILSNHSIHNADSSVSFKENSSKQLHVLLKHMDKMLTELNGKLEVQSYIHIDQLSNSEVFFIQYWLTDCERANNIRQGAYFEIDQDDLLIDESSIFTLTPTVGGKRAPESADRQHLRKKSLIKKTILVTDHDIISFCKDEFSAVIDHVEVRKGVMMADFPDSGFIRTIDIYLSPKKKLDCQLANEDLVFLKNLLQKNSPAMYNYRVFIKSEN